jgi:hypothetical protein
VEGKNARAWGDNPETTDFTDLTDFPTSTRHLGEENDQEV